MIKNKSRGANAPRSASKQPILSPSLETVPRSIDHVPPSVHPAPDTCLTTLVELSIELQQMLFRTGLRFSSAMEVLAQGLFRCNDSVEARLRSLDEGVIVMEGGSVLEPSSPERSCC